MTRIFMASPTASGPAHATVSMEEYLRTSYRPDVEYIDGVLEEKPLVSSVHGRVQLLLGIWFFQHQAEWALIASAEARTQVAVSRVRLPDVVVGQAGFLRQSALLEPPVIAIEVLSPSDSLLDLKRRAADLDGMGVKNVWLIDPESRDASVWRDGYWQKVAGGRVEAVPPPVFLDLPWLWEQLEQS